MKKIICISKVVFILTVVHISIIAQGTWAQLSNCPKKLDHSVGFTIGNKFYTGTGYDSIHYDIITDKFYKYDIASDTWTSIASFPGGMRIHATSFVIGNKGYVGLGSNGTTFINDLWEYDPATNLWTQKSNFPLILSFPTASAFSINYKGYVMIGAGNPSVTFVFEYNPMTDSWLQKNNFPGNAREDAMAESINSKGYFGMGRMWNGNYYPLGDIWEYNDSTDNWILKTNHPNGTNFWVTSLVHNNEMYIGGGAQPNTDLIMKYNPQTNIWTNISSFPSSRHASIGFSYDCNIFVCNGYNNTGNLNELFKLKVDSICNEVGLNEIDAENSISISPNPFSSLVTIHTDYLLQNATLKVDNYLGQTVKQIIKINGHTVTLHRDNLQSGLYLITLADDEKIIATKKIMITD